MASMKRKKFWMAVVLCGGAMLFQLGPTGCTDYMASFALESFDFCSVFNCEGGTFFNFCSPTVLFWDCPQLTTTTG
jgi:hypothetical protein